MIETWKDVPGFNGKYQVSIDTKEGKCRNTKSGKMLNNTRRKGHGKNRIYWNLYLNGQQYTQQAARWIALTYPELIQNEYFEGAQIDHIDNDVTNNQPSNLRWVTGKENCNNPITKQHNIETLRRVGACNSWLNGTDERKEKMLAGLAKGRNGRIVSAETRKKMSDAKKGKQFNRPDKSKPIIQYDLQGNVVKDDWKSAAEVSRTLGYDSSTIAKCCRGKQRTGYGYLWGYK